MAPRKHVRPGSAVPSREIPDDEALTPPPIDIESIRGMGDTVPPPLRDQLETMAGWIGKLSAERLGADRLNRIERDMSALARSATRHEAMLDEMLVPQLQQWRAATDSISQQLPKLIASIESMALLVGDIDRRLRAVEITVSKLVDRVSDDGEQVEHRLGELGDELRAAQKEIRDLQDKERDRDTTQRALAKAERKTSNKWAAIIAAAIGAIGTAISQLVK